MFGPKLTRQPKAPHGKLPDPRGYKDEIQEQLSKPASAGKDVLKRKDIKKDIKDDRAGNDVTKPSSSDAKAGDIQSAAARAKEALNPPTLAEQMLRHMSNK